MGQALANCVHDYYESVAQYYDPAYDADPRLRDLPFYLELAERVGGPVLEIACGTGRVLLPVARLGIEIDGLDFSAALLHELQEKLQREPEEVRSRVNVRQGDMRSFQLQKTFSLITIPFRPLQHLFTVDEQLSTFRSAHTHLRPGGTFAFNVFFPNYQLLDTLGEEQADLEWIDKKNPRITVKRSFMRTAHDKLNQIFEGIFIYRSFQDSKLVSEESATLRMSYYTYPQLRLLLEVTGFEVCEEYGSFLKDPISICRELIFVARKKT